MKGGLPWGFFFYFILLRNVGDGCGELGVGGHCSRRCDVDASCRYIRIQVEITVIRSEYILHR